MLENKLLKTKKIECICGLDENELPNHLSNALEKDLCYNSRAPENCKFSEVINNIKICKYLLNKK